jgi:uncharacterized protein YndB with AHSA1/START domain
MPSEFRVTRSRRISASAAAVFAQVNDFRNWTAWSPWAALDPAMKQTYAGAAAGRGAVYEWAGNRRVGAGRMTIVETSPPERIAITLEFFKPFPATNVAEFTFQRSGGDTLVTWTMSGRKNFMAKVIGLVVDMDRMIGGQFDNGLARMKSIVEATPGAQHGAYNYLDLLPGRPDA